MKTTLNIVATALLATTLAGAAWAQTDSTEPDCPEDMDTEAGCDMSGAESSEAGPIEGAATAPVAPEAGSDAVTTMSEPESDPEASGESDGSDSGSTDAASTESTEPDCPEDFDTEPGCDMSGAESSDSGPVEGAATAPVAPEGDSDAVTTMSEPDADPDASTDAAASTDSAASTDAAASGGPAETHEVMARGVKFDPLFVYVQPGDTVNFSNMASHNVATIDGMIPEGQETIESELGENISVTFDTVGIVTYKCEPHWGNRMGGFVVVGTPDDPGAIIDAYMQSAEENPENLPALGLLKKLRADMEEKGMIQG